MKNMTKTAAAALFLLATAGCANTGPTAYQPDFHDVVRDSNNNIVHSTDGNCVRTQWLNSYDACAEVAPRMHIISQEERTVYFAFNSATLTPEGKARLDSLAQNLKSRNDIKEARIVGFADRLGTAKYNEKLSQKRAETVKAYLVSKGIINARVAETRWFGKSVPATNCGKMPRAQLIECLQKDRRVEVEIDYVVPAAK